MAVSLLLVFLTGLAFSEERPDVKCLVINLDYVHCMWNGSSRPDVNYTFYSRCDQGFKECASYVFENHTVVGCDHPYEELISKRFNFTTKLVLGNRSFEPQSFNLQSKVKLNAPINLRVENTTSNLWYFWNYSCDDWCIESEVRYRTNEKEWKSTFVQQSSYCINLPSSSYLYELQVRGRIGDMCGKSDFWSDWTPSVFWGSRMASGSRGKDRQTTSLTMQTTMFCAVGVIFFIGMVVIVTKHERLKVILIPILPDPGKNLTQILANGSVEIPEEWLPIPKGMKEGLKANYNERPCSVREYHHIPQSASESSSDQTSSSYAFLADSDRSDSSMSLPDD